MTREIQVILAEIRANLERYFQGSEEAGTRIDTLYRELAKLREESGKCKK